LLPCKTGSKPGKKALTTLDAYLDWALSDFSGYISADEMYDEPFCVLSIVDNRTYKRLCYQVLDHDPTHDDIVAFFRPLQSALAARGLTLKGITTEGHLSGRIALDFWRAARALSRGVTLDLLHQARTALGPIRIL